MTAHWTGLSLIIMIAALLGYATYTDLKSRLIPNRIPATIGALAPLSWAATGLAPWPGFALMALQAVACLAVFGFLFARGLMGGGRCQIDQRAVPLAARYGADRISFAHVDPWGRFGFDPTDYGATDAPF